MRDSSGPFVQAYNALAAVDTASQVNVAAELTNQAADVAHLRSMVDQVEANTGQRPEGVLADAGYFDSDVIEELQARGIEVLIPPDKLCHCLRRQGTSSPASPPPVDAYLWDRMRYRLQQPEVLERYRARVRFPSAHAVVSGMESGTMERSMGIAQAA